MSFRRAIGHVLDLSLSVMPDSVFAESDLTEAQFYRATLRGGIFKGATLVKANFRRADLTDATFEKAIIDGADLGHPRLYGCSGFHYALVSTRSHPVRPADTVIAYRAGDQIWVCDGWHPATPAGEIRQRLEQAATSITPELMDLDYVLARLDAVPTACECVPA